MLGANDMSSTGYSALQTVVRWRSLQILDLSDNALTGSVEDALTLYVCEGLGSAECGANTSSVGAPSLRVLKLDGNALTGEMHVTLRGDVDNSLRTECPSARVSCLCGKI